MNEVLEKYSKTFIGIKRNMNRPNNIDKTKITTSDLIPKKKRERTKLRWFMDKFSKSSKNRQFPCY